MLEREIKEGYLIEKMLTIKPKRGPIPWMQRKSLFLHYMCEWSVADIAEHYNVTESNIWWALKGGRSALKGALKNES